MRLAMLGGSFDPLHVGHCVVAQDLFEGLELDRLLVVPSGSPPHRDVVLPADLRFALTRRAFAGDERIEVSRAELERAGPSYTADTLGWIHETYRPTVLFCAIGSDQLRSLEDWRDPERILRLSRLVVMARESEKQRLENPGGFEFRRLPVTRIDLSSTRVRRRLDAGKSVRYLVPDVIHEEVEARWPGRS